MPHEAVTDLLPETGEPPRPRGKDKMGRVQSPHLEWLQDKDIRFPVGKPIPPPAALLKLPRHELDLILQRYKVFAPWNEMIAQAQGYVARLSSIPPGSPDFEDEVNRITQPSSRRGLLGLVRRTQQNYTTMIAAQGNPQQVFIRVTEGGDGVCELCEERAGAMGTLAHHEAIGAPGAASCLGGDYCRCQLYPVD